MASTIAAGTTSGTAIAIAGDTSGVLQLQTNGTTAAVTIDTNQRAAFVAGTALLPAITTTGDTNTGVFFPAADTIAFAEGGTEVMRIDSTGAVGIGTTNPNSFGKFAVNGDLGITNGKFAYFYNSANSNYSAIACVDTTGTAFYTAATERMRITSGGNLLVGKTTEASATAGYEFNTGGSGYSVFTNTRADADGDVLIINRQGSDGRLIEFRQANASEGNISVSGSTVSYNGGHLSRWSQLPDGSKDDAILKGTVMSNLDDMCVWEKEGVVAENEQLNKMKVSDVEGDTNVAGVFVNWTVDEQYGVDDMNVAMTGDMIIRIADGVVVQKGDLLMSAGDGTAKPQGDDIVRSKTVAKVTSNHVTCTYADGSYCVPCVLMAC